jgi:membrane protein YdbS with pleckstrin-like domain
MAYYTKVLQPDETVKAVGRLHWSMYIRGVIVLLIALGVLIGSNWVPDPMWQWYALLASGVIGILGLLLLLAAWVRRRATEIVVTDRRVIFKSGLLTRRTMEMNVSKIETVDVEQGLGGRIWGYGTLLIRGTGSGFEPLVGVGSPLLIRNAIVVG